MPAYFNNFHQKATNDATAIAKGGSVFVPWDLVSHSAILFVYTKSGGNKREGIVFFCLRK